jgi:uncharacterized membrane protein
MATTALRRERPKVYRALDNVVAAPVPAPSPRRRIDAIDFARGIAVTLMILSHGVKGLLAFDQIPAWGLVPVHLVTKFSSSLFILVFGISLAVVYAPHVDTADWPRKRNKMLIRGLKVFFWYKVLTIVEMTPMYSREDILATLLYQAFPVYVEILGFYAIALLWLALLLPLWKRAPMALQWALPAVAGFAGYWLYHNFDFGSDVVQAILVEHEKHYTWGQLARAPLIFLGLLLGTLVLNWHRAGLTRWRSVALFAGISAALFGAFYLTSSGSLQADLVAIAKNEGKHPPELKFMLFSLGGAFLSLAIAFAGGHLLARILRPITVIGQDALQAFICHIFVIFVFYRYLLDYWHNVTYEKALWLTAGVIAVTALWIQVLSWLKDFQRSRS